MQLSRLSKYGTGVNTHDLYKFAALVIMTIDHIGSYIYPEDLWFRAIGRITFPVWFFLAGYAKSSKFPVTLISYAAVLHVIGIVAFYPVFPLNALISILCCRLFISYLQKKGAKFTHKNLFPILICFIIWHLPLVVLFEYGGLALLYALVGHVVRLKNDGLWPDNGTRFSRDNILIAIALMSFIVTQQNDFEFGLLQFLFMVFGTSFTVYKLSGFKVEAVAGKVLAYPVVYYPILLLSRYSLEYYFLHRAFLQVLSCFIVPEHAHLFQWVRLY